MWIVDKSVMRQVRDHILKDMKVRNKFDTLAPFHSDDVDKVYVKYVGRVETMMGIEVARQCMERLKQSKDTMCEELRAVKNAKAAEVKCVDREKKRQRL